jgi:ribose/xylose/arabinose/galactoside ABC-type transport system permease subunit
MTRAGRVTPGAFLVAMALVFVVLPTSQGHDLDGYSVYSALQTFAAFGLITLALGLLMVAGEFDLSLVATYGLSGIVAVELGHPHPLLGIAAAVGVAMVAGAVQGLIVARLRINSMSVTLGGYLVLLGIATAISHSRAVPYPDPSVGIRLDQPIADVLSWRSVITLALFVVAGLAMRFSRLGRDLRAIGGGRPASRVAGVRVDRTIVGAFVAGGALTALGGALQAYSLSTAAPDPGLEPLIFAATAALLGGVSLTGGRGGALGIAAGAIALGLLQTTFGLIASPDWVASVVTGSLLVLAATLSAPGLRTWWRALRAPRPPEPAG